MEQQNHELLGLIVAQQQKMCNELRKNVNKRESALQVRYAAFTETRISSIWEAAKNIMLPHYDQDLTTLEVPLSTYGYYLRKNDVIIGLTVRNRYGIFSKWKCAVKPTGQIQYDVYNQYINERYENLRDISVAEFEKTFIAHLAAVLPTNALKHIEPVEHKEKKGRRRVVAMAE